MTYSFVVLVEDNSSLTIVLIDEQGIVKISDFGISKKNGLFLLYSGQLLYSHTHTLINQVTRLPIE